jgi:DNA polymerase III delta subunit
MTLLFYGTDSYRLRQAMQAATADVRAAGPCHLLTINGADDDAGQCLQEAGSAPGLFGERQVVVISNVAVVPDVKRFLKNVGDMEVIASQDMSRLDAAGKRKTDALAKLIPAAERYDALEGAERLAWMSAFCRERGRNLAPDAAAELVRRSGADTWALAHELEKLCAYAEQTVDEAAVQALVTLPTTYDEWEFSNALAARDKRAALAALWRRLRSGVVEHQLIGLLAAATRTLVTVNEGVHRGLSADAIAKAAGLHPFVVRKNMRSARDADGAALQALHVRIARLDRDTKRGRAELLDGLFNAIVSMP